MKALFLILLCVLPFLSSGQPEKVNTDGKWIVYLDKNWKIITDSSLVSYTCYATYLDGKSIYPLGKYGGDNYTLKTLTDTSVKDHSKMLNGKYQWFDKNNHLYSEHIFENGEPVSIKEFDKKGGLRQHFDFTKHLEEDTLSYCIYQYNRKGLLKNTCILKRDKSGKWPVSR